MQRILIIGAGGHGQVVADIMLANSERGLAMQALGYLDDALQQHGRSLLGLPVLGPLQSLNAIDHDGVVIAIGDNPRRRALFAELTQRGERLVTIQHPSAIIGRDVTIGVGSMICAGAIIGPGSRVGTNCIINTGATVDHHNQIDDHVHIAPGVHLGGNVRIGESTLVGIGAIVMPQRQVGVGAIVGAGCLVHQDIPAYATAIGVPAKLSNESNKE